MRAPRYPAMVLSVAGILVFAGASDPQQTVAVPANDALALYAELNRVAVDPAQVYFIRDARISRGGIDLYFDRGFVGFFTPAGGKITGAVFEGDGEVLLIPPNPAEKRSLAQFIKSAVLEERFTSAYMRFSDNTAQDLLEKARKPGPDDPEQPGDFAQRWDSIIPPLDADYSPRLLADLVGETDLPFFQARVEGVTLGKFELTDDERAPEAVQVTADREAGGKKYTDVWCSFPSKASSARSDALSVGSARVLSYKIQTRIAEDDSLEGRAELELESNSSADRILAFDLSPRLHIQEVTDGNGRKVPLLSEPSDGGSATNKRSRSFVAVALDKPHLAGSKYSLIFTYRGNVIEDVGNDVLYVGARGSWYPNRGFRCRASFDLTFQYPQNLTLVATGRRVEESAAGGRKYSRWISDGDFAVAGFNLGPYDSRRRTVLKVPIEVYATREAEAALVKRYIDAHPPMVVLSAPLVNGRHDIKIIPQPSPPSLDPSQLLDEVLDKASESVRYFSTLFGKFPYPRLDISQIPGDFGQGWPELVYLPTLSFLPGEERVQLGQHAQEQDLETGLFVAHEIAHQWWGNEVGWKSYHDQWISEGFASYAAALFLARDKGGARKFRDLMRQYKRDLLTKTPEGKTVESGGPIWLGRRLSNSLNPSGYSNIVYKKSCWVLHMLRKLMTDPRTGSDARFFAMLRAFAESHYGRDASTEDFLAKADHYMTPAMDLDGNHRLNWFFDDWVYGTGIPTYKLEDKSRRLSGDRYVVEGRVKQSGVPDGFEMLVPLVAAEGHDRKIHLGSVAVPGSGGRFRFVTHARPARVEIDDDDLLAIVK